MMKEENDLPGYWYLSIQSLDHWLKNEESLRTEGWTMDTYAEKAFGGKDKRERSWE